MADALQALFEKSHCFSQLPNLLSGDLCLWEISLMLRRSNNSVVALQLELRDFRSLT